MDATPQATSLNEARSRAGWTMEQLADQLRVTRQAVSTWESGSSAPGGPARLVLASLFSVPVEVVDGWFARTKEAA